MWDILCSECGYDGGRDGFRDVARNVVDCIDGVVCDDFDNGYDGYDDNGGGDDDDGDDDNANDNDQDNDNDYDNDHDKDSDKGAINGGIPNALEMYYNKNENNWKNHVRVDIQHVKLALDEVKECKRMLNNVVKNDYDNNVVYDVYNNIIVAKKVNNTILGCRDDGYYYHPRDRYGKTIKNRYTSKKLEFWVQKYVHSTDNAAKVVENELKKLAMKLLDVDSFIDVVRCSGFVNVVSMFINEHTKSSVSKGWNLGCTFDDHSLSDVDVVNAVNGDNDNNSSSNNNIDNNDDNNVNKKESVLKGLWPYWMNKYDGIRNDVNLNNITLLTAPNMSGKSTLMRSSATAVLLTLCGLFSPTDHGYVKKYNNVFFRAASSDVPSEGKSAFGKECEDVTEMFDKCDSQSLVFIDELGRGTSPTDGTALAGAVLEGMCERGYDGFFATHLHGILDLDLKDDVKKRIVKRKMGIEENDDHEVEWTYKLEDGVSTDSLALVTAARFGMPQNIIDRASYFANNSVSGNGGTLRVHGELTPSEILEKVCQGNSVSVPVGFEPPPFLEGCSVVYVLEVPFLVNGGTGKGRGNNNKMIYVGETDGLTRRLNEHRSRKDMGLDWSFLQATCVPVRQGKGQARQWETMAIRKMQDAGFNLVSAKDGQNSHFGGN
jgi:hypothetical protein